MTLLKLSLLCVHGIVILFLVSFLNFVNYNLKIIYIFHLCFNNRFIYLHWRETYIFNSYF